MKLAAHSSTATKSSAGQSRPFLLAVICFVLGAGLSGFWFHRHQAGAAAGELATPTRNLLNQLPAATTIRYYSLLPAGSADASLQAFAGRVADLLNMMQTASGGKLQITMVDTPADTNANAASADGIQAFNLEKGDACFLGMAIASGKNQETLARLQPEWEPALQYDLARAIERVTAVSPPPKPAPEVAKPSPEIVSSIHQLIPDLNATSLADADQIFHDDFLKQCIAASQKFQEEINAASERVTHAQANGSANDEETARKHLQELQLAQGEKLKALAARLQIQLAVFQQMKNAAANAAK
jgi:hypothetical protein